VNVVLLHAFPIDSRMWQNQRLEHDIVAPDLYWLGSVPTMEEWARAVLGRVEGDFVAVGASMGGYCALAMARIAPERMRALVLVGARAGADTPERREGRAATIELIRRGGAEALWEDMRPKLFPEGADLRIVDWARTMTLAQEPQALIRAVQAIRDRRDSSAVVEKLACPVLVAVGESDPFLSVDEAEALAESAADGRLIVFPSGHLPSLERPDEFNSALTGLLRTLIS
jgi:pimeloyl-ACP methyl ester carboxylesterase